jgi:hypothetical protein
MMEITTNDRSGALSLHSLSPLLAAITLAEEISRDVSARQASIARLPLRLALKQQSWQETAHAAAFRTALQFVPGPPCPAPVAKALHRFSRELHADLDRKALAASMIGMQCVLEGLGAVALQPPPGEVATLADRIFPLRAIVLHQELGHQRLGEAWVPRLGIEPVRLHKTLNIYLELAQALLDAGLSTLDCLAGARAHYQDAVEAHFRATTDLFSRFSSEA